MGPAVAALPNLFRSSRGIRSREFLPMTTLSESLTIADRKSGDFFYRAERLLLDNVSLRALTKMFDRLKEI
jgi:hypothetical protein